MNVFFKGYENGGTFCVFSDYPSQLEGTKCDQKVYAKVKFRSVLCAKVRLYVAPQDYFFYCLQAGDYIVTLMDSYGADFSVLFVAVCECIAVMWVYGK